MAWLVLGFFLFFGGLWILGGIAGFINDLAKSAEGAKRAKELERKKKDELLARHRKIRGDLGYLPEIYDEAKVTELMSFDEKKWKELSDLVKSRIAERDEYKRPISEEIHRIQESIRVSLIKHIERSGQQAIGKNYFDGIFNAKLDMRSNSDLVDYYTTFLFNILTAPVPLNIEAIAENCELVPDSPKPTLLQSPPKLEFQKVPLRPISEEEEFFSDGKFDSDRFARRLADWELLNAAKESAIGKYENEMRQFLLTEIDARKRGVAEVSSAKSYQKLCETYGDLVNAWIRYKAGAVVQFPHILKAQIEALMLPDYLCSKMFANVDPETGILVFDFNLPAPGQLQFVKGVKQLKSTGEIRAQHATEKAKKLIYDDFIYQVALSLVDFTFRVDSAEKITAVAFNGLVEGPSESTGLVESNCVLSLICKREDFLGLDLSKVNPKECFKYFKGVSGANLHTLTPVRPILRFDKNDSRFVSADSVIETLNDSLNLAAMHWSDFEALIRDLFSKEFSTEGAEVKITRGSKDGGVDAVVFDPDPIKGGKFIIQAKRYTNVVGVSAVRDLYGTVMNEGANRGILVTTASYGPDAYEFVRDKPLSLISGSELLHMLKKHGYAARIDLKEAKEILEREAKSS